ncbi:exopolyphosphatase [Fructobacillus sp. M2-14]|uniref:Exopolyphosphatase n=1 Tax=Fructobacillus broussonetiae TaxID=2713173 RepID=A0ABS5QZJ7_9LACO|nr:exopolyphosphatase [Fructobacillus broussonetiae]MBS9338623.1 exopolyphosphatase [Fructobacillus broussonetiae]
MQKKKIAIIDLGSNSARLVLEQFNSDGTYRELLREKEDTRLSKGMGETLLLQVSQMDKTIEVLKKYKAVIDKNGITEIHGITTAAVRTAKNQKEFLDRVREEVGIELRILTGEEEAHYDFLGVLDCLPDVKRAVILDTGGASVEVVPYQNKKAELEVSLPFGAVNLSEKFELADKVKEENIHRACEKIQKSFQELAFEKQYEGWPVILLGGANRSLAKMAEKNAWTSCGVDQLHGLSITQEHVKEIFHTISHMTREEREHLAGLEKNRADIIISGLLPVLNLTRVLRSPSVIFSESGVREGLIFELIAKEMKEE